MSENEDYNSKNEELDQDLEGAPEDNRASVEDEAPFDRSPLAQDADEPSLKDESLDADSSDEELDWSAVDFDEQYEDHYVGGRAVNYDGFENPIGLTQAFAPIELPEDDSDGASWSLSWSNRATGPSNGWDQIVPDDDTPDDWHEPDDGMFSQEDENVRRRARRRAAHHAVMEYDGIPDEEYERAAAETDFNEQVVAALAAEKQARSEGADAYAAAAAAAAAGAAAAEKEAVEAELELEEVFASDTLTTQPASDVQTESGAARSKGGHGKHSKGKQEISVHERKSRRTRRMLIVIIVLLIALLGAIGYFAYHLFTTGETVAVQQTQTSAVSTEVINNDMSEDATSATSKKTDVPNLVGLLGLTTDEALEKLGHGATVKSEREVNEEGNPIKRSLTVPLTDEPADTKTGTPTVYLGLNEEGRVVQAGYSTSTASLGFGAIGFADAVANEHVVEKTLRDSGVRVEDGVAVLPADKMEYSTYDTDGTTLKRERYSFNGSTTAGETTYNWSSVLSYDYANANLTGNLADTVRVIYVYVGQ